MKTMRTLSRVLVLAAFAAPAACDKEPKSEPTTITHADLGKAIDKLDDSTEVLRDLTTKSEIPFAQRARARCIVVVPKFKSAAFLVGGQHGDGVVSCRTGSGWSGPAFIKMSGPTAGLQAGVQSEDLLMLVMTENAVSKLFRKDLQLGADASVAAGPTGASAKAVTDAQATAEFLTYSHAKGLFVGVDVNGMVIKQNLVFQVALYGNGAEVKRILAGGIAAPKEAAPFLAQVRSSFP
jgi:SH3 domain-containing YSC84-like protein 1